MSDYEPRMYGREELVELEAVLETAVSEMLEMDKGLRGPQYRNLKRYMGIAGVALEGALSESRVMRARLERLERGIAEMAS